MIFIIYQGQSRELIGISFLYLEYGVIAADLYYAILFIEDDL